MSEQTQREEWRDEMYGDEGGNDPFWVPLEDARGDYRDAVEAAQLVRGFIGGESFREGLTVELVRGRMENKGIEGWWFSKDADGGVACWEVCCS